ELAAGLQAILSVEQLDRWPALERQLVRQKQLARGRLSGESVNLLSIVNELNVDREADTTLESLLLQYEIDLHSALIARDRVLQETSGDMLEAAHRGDRGAAEPVIDRRIAAHQRVLEVNDRHVEIIAAALAPRKAGRFVDTYHRRAFPRLFAPSLVERVLRDSEQRLPDLDEATRTLFSELRVQYRQDLRDVQAEIIRARRVEEPVELRSAIRRRWSKLGLPAGAAPEEPRSLEKRTRLDQRYLDAIRDRLTPAQKQRIPGLR
ncbi:MAG: hypothetical protein ACYTGC_05265, partial [Planctomycetota bacterium]